MNAERRKAIEAIANALDKVCGWSAEASEIETLKDEEQEYYDNMPESLQSGEKGSDAEEAVGYLETAAEKLQEAEEAMNEAITALRDAMGS